MTEGTKRLAKGDALPEFSLLDQNGARVSSVDLLNQSAIIYFFPAAGSPGCTKEASDFELKLDEFQRLGFRVIGVSPDSVEKLKNFEEVHELTFTLLSDPELSAHKAFGAWGEKSLYGRLYKGVLRSTMIVSKGKIVDAMYNVKATGHTNMLLRRLGA